MNLQKRYFKMYTLKSRFHKYQYLVKILSITYKNLLNKNLLKLENKIILTNSISGHICITKTFAVSKIRLFLCQNIF